MGKANAWGRLNIHVDLWLKIRWENRNYEPLKYILRSRKRKIWGMKWRNRTCHENWEFGKKNIAFINVQHHNIKTLFLHLKQHQFSGKLVQLLWCKPANKIVSQWDLTCCWQVFKGVGEEEKSEEKNAKIHILQGSKTTLAETTAKLDASIKLPSAMT